MRRLELTKKLEITTGTALVSKQETRLMISSPFNHSRRISTRWDIHRAMGLLVLVYALIPAFSHIANIPDLVSQGKRR